MFREEEWQEHTDLDFRNLESFPNITDAVSGVLNEPLIAILNGSAQEAHEEFRRRQEYILAGLC